MTEDLAAPAPGTASDGLPDHEVRTALLRLLETEGTVTATLAARRLGYSSGLCSFHLRRLARHGRIEPVPTSGGRARPWRLRSSAPTAGEPRAAQPAGEFDQLARRLEDESYQRWLAHRDRAEPQWRHDEAFSSVVYLTPEELGQVADSVRRLLAEFRHREADPAARPAGARPVAAITRLFPLLPGATE
ncbi:helix-turn-helix domain-containing protein [Kitasatospora sp. RB6PN24]|uniref:winged helix-turn-helix domain-containing protein n=1 Tax=Kitasatospora humi TaxID=2893891 RepID=UPI001E4A4C49|nr:helix-turn-helix domain-containing protein [Kitasatospora humi]MCC9305985.1 helix-turn-helix domain-containing protein [Kitasatospora humi]